MTERGPEGVRPRAPVRAPRVVPVSPHRAAPVSASRVAPVALLVLGTSIGLIGGIGRLSWSGPLATQAFAVGAALEVVLIALFGITFVRDVIHESAYAETASQLRFWLRYLLAGLIVAVAVLLIAKAHLHLPSGSPHIRPAPLKPPLGLHLKGQRPGESLPSWVLYVLLAICVLAAILAAVYLSLRLRQPGAMLPRGGTAVDPEDLHDALAQGAAALREASYDDARKAIIACYLAMERRLSGKGAGKSDADTPDELLARATAAGLIHGPGARTLTGLFYEARFSTHPLGNDKRDTARQALDDMMAEVRA